MGVMGSPFVTESQPSTVAFSPIIGGNLFAAVTSELQNSVSMYTVNTQTGAFTPVSGSPFATGHMPIALAFSPAINLQDEFTEYVPVKPVARIIGDYLGEILFLGIANMLNNSITIYKVDTETGTLEHITDAPTNGTPIAITFGFKPINGKLTIRVENQEGTFTEYLLDVNSGFLTPDAESENF